MNLPEPNRLQDHLFRLRRTPVRRYAVVLLTLLAIAPRLFAAGEVDDSWAKLSKKLVIGNVTLQLTARQKGRTPQNREKYH
jgi:hypothetical protein